MTVPYDDWPFGVELKRRRLHHGFSVKKAARLTGGRVSDARWTHLEAGFQRVGGHRIVTRPTPRTVIAMAQVLGWPVADALAMAGFDPAECGAEEMDREHPILLSALSDAELIAELCRRLARRYQPQDGGIRPDVIPPELVRDPREVPAGEEESGVVGEPNGCGGCDALGG